MNEDLNFPTCEQCGERLSPLNTSEKPDLCVNCYNYLKTGEQKRCIICRKPIKPTEKVVRQQVGTVTAKGEFKNYQTLWYQHGKCRTNSKFTRNKGSNQAKSRLKSWEVNWMVKVWELDNPNYKRCGTRLKKGGGFFRCTNCRAFYILKESGLVHHWENFKLANLQVPEWSSPEER